MRIFHGPNNVGGMAGELARAHRALGEHARAYCIASDVYGFQGDARWPPSGPAAVLQPWVFLFTEALRFDVFQFYYGTTLSGFELDDVEWLKKRGKKIFFYFCGCDVRDSKATIAKYRFSACKECWPQNCNPNQARAIELAGEIADGSFVSTPDLLEFVPRSTLLPQPVSFAAIEEVLRGEMRAAPGEVVRIAHAPTDRQKKGTRHIVAAVESLRRRGLAVELVLIERCTREEVLRKVAGVDLVVDQVLIGAYGMLSIEAMALGKPVVCYLREDLVAKYPEPPPIVNADPDTLADKLLDLLGSRETWPALAAAGKAYARRWHESGVIARRLLEAYRA